MPYLVSLSDYAIGDIDEAVDFYKGLSAGLGFEFTDTLNVYFKKIASLPTASAVRYDNIRVKPLDTFPFTIHFKIINDSNIIIGYLILHKNQ